MQDQQDVIIFLLLIGFGSIEIMSKSFRHYYIRIHEAPELMFEKRIKIPDKLMNKYFSLTTDMDQGIFAKLIEMAIRAPRPTLYTRVKLYVYTMAKMMYQAESSYQKSRIG